MKCQEGKSGGAAGLGVGAPTPSHGAVHTPALSCSHSVITEITEACFILQSLYSLLFLFGTLQFKKKINIGFGFIPKGNIMQFIFCFRGKMLGSINWTGFIEHLLCTQTHASSYQGRRASIY